LVTASGIPRYRFWAGERIELPVIAFDTETELIQDHVVPRLALATSFDENEAIVIHPDQALEFLRVHQDQEFVFHNAAFDFWVLFEHFAKTSASDLGTSLLWRLLDGHQIHDTMVLDLLLRIARGERKSSSRNLAELCRDFLGQDLLNKEDPYRIRYGEIIGKDFENVEKNFFEYAAKDAVATYYIYRCLLDEAWQYHDDIGVGASGQNLKRYGFMTEQIQIKAAVALAKIERDGIAIDPDHIATLKSEFQREIQEHFETLATLRPEIFKRNRDGSFAKTAGGGNSMSHKDLEAVLTQEVSAIEQSRHMTIEIPRTDKGKISKKAEDWERFRKDSEFLGHWLDHGAKQKLLSFLDLEPDESGRIHPRYTTLVSTGRTSSWSPNLQNIPRDPRFRRIFRARPGSTLFIIDYAYIELVTLARICEAMFGESRLGEIIRAGQDPHVATAALMSGMTVEAFLSLATTDKPRFRAERQKGKAVNFGIPGGMSGNTLIEYAAQNYGVELTSHEAATLREEFIAGYHELRRYLRKDDLETLCRNLRATEDELLADFPNGSEWIATCVGKIVSGTPYTTQGRRYQDDFVDRVWAMLARCCRNPGLQAELSGQIPSRGLADRLFGRVATTLTGRVRAGLSFTESRNTPFQGLAADGAKTAVYRLVRAGYRVVGFVHDEIIVEIPGEWREDAAEHRRIQGIVEGAMRDVLDGSLPVKTESVVSDHWTKG
ncbi:MAG: hypothetical protein JNM63_14280, partial [Spirochaetia bacterium]|nr:hypothetical protein [Spirochaetia bacterium]